MYVCVYGVGGGWKWAELTCRSCGLVGGDVVFYYPTYMYMVQCLDQSELRLLIPGCGGTPPKVRVTPP